MDDFLSGIFVIGFACCLPTLAIGGPVAWILYRNKQRKESSTAIAAALNLQPTAKFKQMQWYEGRLANGRLFAYIPIVFQRDSYITGDGRRRNAYDSAARLVVEVKRERPLNVNITRHQKWTTKKRPLSSFETAFTATNGSKLTSNQQQALLNFVQQNPGTFWLRDREGASTNIFNAPEVMAGATTFLLHEYKVKNPTPDEIREKTAVLSQLAHLFDEGNF
jgi:hypothetical protein